MPISLKAQSSNISKDLEKVLKARQNLDFRYYIWYTDLSKKEGIMDLTTQTYQLLGIIGILFGAWRYLESKFAKLDDKINDIDKRLSKVEWDIELTKQTMLKIAGHDVAHTYLTHPPLQNNPAKPESKDKSED